MDLSFLERKRLRKKIGIKMSLRSAFADLLLFIRKVFCTHNFINQRRMMGMVKNPNHHISGSVVFGPRMVGTFFMVSQCSRCGKIKRVEEPNGQEEAYQMILKNPPQGGSRMRK